ncbi:MAG: glycogen/starch synthase [Candidatus Pacebacteria bacterium]|nr:glycogen/starch synthase [Candidatus Paceibacterota bacterium]
MKKPLKILFVTTDLYPFCKAGGLSDVSCALPKALKEAGHDVRIMLPRHGVIDEEKGSIKLLRDNLHVSFSDQKIVFRIKKSYLSETIPVYFVDKYKYFGSRSRLYGYEDDNKRFLFFCRAVLKSIKILATEEDWTPDVIHCNDWHTGLIPYFIKSDYAEDRRLGKMKTLFTIHNLTFQMKKDWWTISGRHKDDGKYPIKKFEDKKSVDYINFAKRGIMYSDLVNTVSESYAQEVMQKDFGQDLHQVIVERFERGEFFGIVNGIDYKEYNPVTDPGLAVQYNVDSIEKKYINKAALQKEYGLKVDKNIPLLGMVTRITEQKGFDLLMEIISPLLRLDLQLIIVGDGDRRYKNFFSKIEKKKPGKLVAHMKFKTENVTQIYAASDMFLMPSRFEPCGLGQMISLRYGSVPIVRETGGLSDTIKNFNPKTGKGNGFTFGAYDRYAFFAAIVRALETYKYRAIWNKIVTNGMQESFSWEVPAQKYLKLYRKMLKK